MIRDRVRAGLAWAKTSGTKSGKAIGRPAVPEELNRRIRELVLAGAEASERSPHSLVCPGRRLPRVRRAEGGG
jgi:hypothetical protein